MCFIERDGVFAIGAAPLDGAPEEEVADHLRMFGRKGHRDRRGEAREEREAVQAGGPYDGFRVEHEVVDAVFVDLAVGEALSPAVEGNQPEAVGEALEGVAEDGVLPLLLEVVHGVGDVEDGGALAHIQVRDRDSVFRAGVADGRHFHRPSLIVEAAGRAERTTLALGGSSLRVLVLERRKSR